MMQDGYIVEIAGINIEVRISKEIEIEESFQSFICEKEPDTRVTFLGVEQLPEVCGSDLVTESNTSFAEYRVDHQYIRVFHPFDGIEEYAVLCQKGPKEWICEYLLSHSARITSIQDCFSHMALERILLENQAMILHASLIKVMIGQREVGVLFTGVSGIGKSTQAELWQQYEHAAILNGDRAVLRKKGNRWYGYGSPYAGSSNIYRNEGVPICAVVALEQAVTNECFRLRIQDAFKKIYAGLTINTWNPQFVEQILEWNTDVCMNVPVFTLRCRPEKEAVEVLKKNLEQL